MANSATALRVSSRSLLRSSSLIAGAPQELLDVAAGAGRGVEKQDVADFAAGVLPSMRDVAREERARRGDTQEGAGCAGGSWGARHAGAESGSLCHGDGPTDGTSAAGGC